MSADFSTRPRPKESPLVSRLLVAAGSLLLAVSAGHAGRALLARNVARQELARMRGDVEAQRAHVVSLERVSGRDATLQRQVELTSRASPPRVIADLAPLLPGGALVQRLILDYKDRLEVELRVEARSPAEYDRLLRALVASARLESVLPGTESREGSVASTIKAVYRPREER